MIKEPLSIDGARWKRSSGTVSGVKAGVVSRRAFHTAAAAGGEHGGEHGGGAEASTDRGTATRVWKKLKGCSRLAAPSHGIPTLATAS